MPWMIPVAIAGSAALGAGSSLIGSGKASSAAKDSARLQSDIYQQNVARAAPFVAAGSNALSLLPDMLPGVFTQEELQKMPGYQFALDQGLKSTQSAIAARGLGVSGAALKGAARFATGLADQTYQNAFNQQQARYSDVFNVAQLGANASAGLGSQGVTSGQSQGNALANAGVYSAQGGINASNALSQGVQNYLSYNTLNSLINNGGSGLSSNISPATSQLAAMPSGSWFT